MKLLHLAAIAWLATLPGLAADRQATPPSLDVSAPVPVPAFSALARAKGEQAIVVVYVKVDKTGAVAKTRLGKSSGFRDLDDDALAVATDWRFHPAVLDGEAVVRWAAVGLRFSVAGVTLVPEELEAGFDETRLDSPTAEVICRNTDPPVGSHLPGKKICLTQKGWDDLHDSSERGVKHEIDSPRNNASGEH